MQKAYKNRGVVKYKLGNYKDAIADFQKQMELDPNDASAYKNRGVTKGKLGDYEGAVEDLKKSIELDPSTKYELQDLIDLAQAKIK